MNRRVSIIFSFIILWVCGLLNGQDCKEALDCTYQNIEANFQLAPDKVCYLSYQMRVKAKGEDAWQTTEIEVYANAEKSYLISDEIEVYQDQETTVSITPPNRSVFVGHSSPHSVKEAQLQAMRPYQDTLLAYAEQVVCTKLEGGLERVELILNERAQQLFQLRKVITTHRPDLGEVVKIQLFYHPAHPYLEEAVLNFREISNDHETQLLERDALDFVYQSNHTLVDRLQGFEVTDLKTREP